MTEHIHHPTAEEEWQREARRSSPFEARVPPSPPADEYDLARAREKLERVLTK